MAKRTVKVEIPISNQDKFISLGDSLIEKNKKLADNSMLKSSDVELFSKIIEKAKTLRNEALELHKQAESKMEQSRIQLGINAGQNSNTPGTAYFHIAKFRDSLLSEFRGAEEQLSQYGFKVVVGKAKSPRKNVEIPESLSSPEIQ